MDRLRNDAPALAYVKDVRTWVVVNNKCEPILWTEDAAELAWLLIWVLEYGAIKQKQRFRSRAIRHDFLSTAEVVMKEIFPVTGEDDARLRDAATAGISHRIKVTRPGHHRFITEGCVVRVAKEK